MRIPVVDGEGREVSHLAVSVSRPDDFEPTASLLYLHGFGSCQGGEKADFFRARAVDAGLSFWSFDFQGHGESGGGMRELSLTRMLSDIDRVRDAMREAGEHNVVILGSSMGGLAGLWHAATSDDPVAAGLYIAPAVGLEGAFRAWAGAEGLDRWQREGVFEVANELGSWQLGWGFVEDLRRHSNEALARALRTPSLIVQGQRDDRVSWREVVDFSTTCRERCVELHLFTDGDHRLIDRLEHLWSLMHGFLVARDLLR